MKKTFRLTALILALLMLVNISASATTNGIPVENLKMADWSNMLQTATQAAQVSEDAETVDVDEVGTYYWGYITAEKYLSSTAVVGGDLGVIPAYTFIKVYDDAVGGGLYKVVYEGKVGYVSAYSPIPACECQNSTQDDPNTHIGTCVYPTAFMTLANNSDAAGLFAKWSTFTAGEQAYILAYLQNVDNPKYTALYALLNPVTEQEKTETVDGTTVSVSGSIPADVELKISAVSDDTIASYIPNISSIPFGRIQLDITLKDVNGNVWQPGSAVDVTISANGLGNNGDLIALFHIHDGKVEFVGTPVVKNGNISFKMSGFSYILGINVSEDCSDGDKCGYAAFEGKTIAEKEAGLKELYNERPAGASYSPNLSIFMAHVIAYHANEANICMCIGDYHPDTHGYGTIAHGGYWVDEEPSDCPWAFKSLTLQEQAGVLEKITDAETREDYLETLTADQRTALESYLNMDEQTRLTLALNDKYGEAAITTWFSQYTVTVEMMQRALRASSLESVVLEGDLTGYADLYYVRSGQAIAYYQYNADESRGEIIEPSCQLVVAYVVNGVVTPVPEATAAN